MASLIDFCKLLIFKEVLLKNIFEIKFHCQANVKKWCCSKHGQQVTEVDTRAFNMFYLCFSFTLFYSSEFCCVYLFLFFLYHRE